MANGPIGATVYHALGWFVIAMERVAMQTPPYIVLIAHAAPAPAATIIAINDCTGPILIFKSQRGCARFAASAHRICMNTTAAGSK
jgi:hypothetical protein